MSLVLVLGAGASKEVGLPTGAELTSSIAELLDIRFEFGRDQVSGDRDVTDALRLQAADPQGRRGDINPLLASCWRIRDAMPQALSIDNFIDCHDDPPIAQCGKIAIARSILMAEAASLLAIDKFTPNPRLPFAPLAPTWLNGFFQLLTQNCRLKDLASRFANITVVVFNYDRCFEQFLYYAIQNFYGASPAQAAELVTKLTIFHPYGMVGTLPWMGESTPIDFGASVHAHDLVSISRRLRTFTESTDPVSSDIDAIRSSIHAASQLLFLGFAFHRLNMDLLFGQRPHSSRVGAAFGTAFGISAANCTAISSELAQRTNDACSVQLRNDLTCARLIHEYSRHLALG